MTRTPAQPTSSTRRPAMRPTAKWAIAAAAFAAVIGTIIWTQSAGTESTATSPSAHSTPAASATRAGTDGGTSSAPSPSPDTEQSSPDGTASRSTQAATPQSPAVLETGFVTAAESTLLHLRDVGERIRIALTDGTDVRAVTSEGQSVIGELSAIRPPDASAARWDAQVTRLNTVLAAVATSAVQGNNSAARGAAVDLSIEAESAMSWVQSLR